MARTKKDKSTKGFNFYTELSPEMEKDLADIAKVFPMHKSEIAGIALDLFIGIYKPFSEAMDNFKDLLPKSNKEIAEKAAMLFFENYKERELIEDGKTQLQIEKEDDTNFNNGKLLRTRKF